MAAAPHKVLEVVCPWCSSEKTSSRIGDLKKHVAIAHPDLVDALPDKFFSEGNGFWLATRPQDYLRVVTPSAEQCDIAVVAREALLNWLKVAGPTSRDAAAWQEGWRMPSQECASASVVYESPLVAKRLRLEPDSATPSASDLDVAYSPSRPAIQEYSNTLVACDMDQRKIWLKSTVGTWYELILSEEFLNDSKAVSSLKRRMECLGQYTPEERPTRDFAPLSGPTLPAMARVLSRDVGIPVQFMESISVLDVTFQFTGQLPVPFPSFRNSNVKPCDTNCEPEDPTIRYSPSVPLSSPVMTTSDAERPPSNNNIPTVLSTIPTNVTATTVTATAPYSLSTSSGTAPVSDTDRAKKILHFGAMPLVPPARRDWSKAPHQVRLEGRVESIHWPPRNWQRMSAQQRLGAWELAALRLDANEEGVPRTEKAKVLDSYSFLALPGTAQPPVRPSDQSSAKARLYTYKVLVDLATKGTGDTDLLAMLELASQLRDSSVDSLITNLEINSVPVRY